MAMKRKNKKVVQKGKKVKFGPEKTEERKTSSYAAKENYVGTFRWAKLQGLKMMWPVLVKSITPDKVLVYVKSDDDMIYISNNESNIQPYPGNLDCLKDNGIAYLKAKKMNRTLECFIQDLEWALEKYQEIEAAGEVRAGINKFKGGEEIHSVFVTEHDKACVDSNARAVPECGDVEIETGIQAVTGNQTGSESEGISGKDIETKAKYTSGKEIQKVLDTEYENECDDSRSKNQETKTRDVPEFGNVEIETGIQTVTGKQTDSESEGISGKDWETKKLIGGEEIQTVYSDSDIYHENFSADDYVSPDIVNEALDEAETFFDYLGEKKSELKKPRKNATNLQKVYWSQEEEEEIKLCLRHFFDRKIRPKPSDCMKAILKSQKENGLIGKRKKDVLKKKVFRMIDKL